MRQGWLLEVVITDGSRTLNCRFFNMRQYSVKLKPGASALFAGTVSIFQEQAAAHQPRVPVGRRGDHRELCCRLSDRHFMGLIPVYSAAAKMQTWQVAKCVQQTLELLDALDDPIPPELRGGKMTFAKAIRAIHSAKGWTGVNAARSRLRWGEALAVQLARARRRSVATARPAPACPRRDESIRAAFDARLPFELTAG